MSRYECNIHFLKINFQVNEIQKYEMKSNTSILFNVPFSLLLSPLKLDKYKTPIYEKKERK